jgi:hypothetical protein
MPALAQTVGRTTLEHTARAFSKAAFRSLTPSSGEWTIDILIYPAAFSFRHGIELYLKHMVHLFDEIANSGAYTKTHSLQDNWSVFERQAIANKDGSFDPVELSIAKDIIDDFCNIDPTGQVFRYPEDIKGNKHLIGLGVINVEVLEDGMRVLHELFEGWRLVLDVMRTSRP